MNKKILFIAPAEGTQGGISAVIDNYKCSRFWSQYNGGHFSTSIESDSRLYALLYQIKQIIIFFVYILFTRPRAASIHTASWNSFYRSFIYILIAWLLRIPVVLHIHPVFFHEFYIRGGLVRKSLIKIAGKMSTKIVFLTSSIRDLFVSIFPGKELLVLPNPVNVSLFESDVCSHKRNRMQLLFMGWIVKEKGVYDIVDIIPEIITAFPDARFIFAGNKEISQLRDLIEPRKLNKFASVPGWVSGQDKVDLLLTSGVLLLPTYSEGVPNVILEAMASGLPIITTPVGGIPSILEDGVSGLFVNPGNKEELKTAVLKLLSDEVLSKNISQEAKLLVKQLYDVEIIGKKLEEIYRDFII